jgi:plastocyanin
MVRRRGFAIATAAILLLLLGAACADAEGPEPAAGGSGPDETAATAPTTPTAPTGGDMGSDAGGGRYDYGPGGADVGDGDGGSGGLDADVVADNYAFAPSEVDASVGSTLPVGNANGGTPHTFTIDGTDVDVELAPMAIEEVTLDLDPGTYDFRCRFHASMTGTLTIS